MKLAEIDWGILRGAIILLVLVVVVSGGLLGGSYYFWKKKDAEYQRENRALLAARSQYQNIDMEEKVIEDYFPRYKALETAGIIGNERRLDWIDTLRRAAQRVELPTLRYVIESQRLFRPEFPLPEGVFQVFASEMALDLGLLHEGDLPTLLADLNRNATGLYTVAECDLRRAQTEFIKNPNAVNLTAQCGLRWLTIKPSAAPAF